MECNSGFRFYILVNVHVVSPLLKAACWTAGIVLLTQIQELVPFIARCSTDINKLGCCFFFQVKF